MSQFRPKRPILLTSISFAVIAVTMWGGAIAAISGIRDLSDRALSADLAGAGSASVVAALCWAVSRRDAADRDKTILIGTLARTLPLPRVP